MTICSFLTVPPDSVLIGMSKFIAGGSHHGTALAQMVWGHKMMIPGCELKDDSHVV